MRKTTILFGAATCLAACGQSANNAEANNAAANGAATEKARPAYCFFKGSATKAWKAKIDKDGNVVVSGKAYREDPRYKALLSPAVVSGPTAEVAPTVGQNDTGFASPDNWWELSETIPNSQAVSTVNIKCGEDTLASLPVPRKK